MKHIKLLNPSIFCDLHFKSFQLPFWIVIFWFIQYVWGLDHHGLHTRNVNVYMSLVEYHYCFYLLPCQRFFLLPNFSTTRSQLMNFHLVLKIKTNAHARAVFKISFPAAGPPSGDRRRWRLPLLAREKISWLHVVTKLSRRPEVCTDLRIDFYLLLFLFWQT